MVVNYEEGTQTRPGGRRGGGRRGRRTSEAAAPARLLCAAMLRWWRASQLRFPRHGGCRAGRLFADYADRDHQRADEARGDGQHQSTDRLQHCHPSRNESGLGNVRGCAGGDSGRECRLCIPPRRRSNRSGRNQPAAGRNHHGTVDHGKTKLLDAIRSTNVARARPAVLRMSAPIRSKPRAARSLSS